MTRNSEKHLKLAKYCYLTVKKKTRLYINSCEYNYLFSITNEQNISLALELTFYRLPGSITCCRIVFRAHS